MLHEHFSFSALHKYGVFVQWSAAQCTRDMTYSSSLRASWCLSYSHADKNRWESMCVRIWAGQCDWHASVLDWSIKIIHQIDFLLIAMCLDSYGESVVSLTVFQLCKVFTVICSNPNITVLFKLQVCLGMSFSPLSFSRNVYRCLPYIPGVGVWFCCVRGVCVSLHGYHGFFQADWYL